MAITNKFDRTKFFDGFRERLDSTISQEQVDGLEFLLGRMENDPFWQSIPQMAYGLATVFHETATSFQPVEEGYYLGSAAKVKAFQKTLRYYPYFGRGFVQLTWAKNYKHATAEIERQLPHLVAEYNARWAISFDLSAHPDQALDPLIAYAVLTLGMHQGWFGTQLDHYVNATKKDYAGARHSVNGTDKAGLIAGYAVSFEKILNASLITTSAAPALSSEDQTGLPESVPPPMGQTPLSGNQDTPPKSDVIPVEVVAAERSESIDQTITKWSSRWMAIPAAATTFIGGIFSWVTNSPVNLTITLVVGGCAVAGLYFGLRQIAGMFKDKRQTALTEAREQRAHEIQMAMINAAASPDKNTVKLIPPPPVAELPNSSPIEGDTAGVLA